MRVAFVSPYPLGAVSGISTFLLDLGAELRRGGDEGVFLGPKGPAVPAPFGVVEFPLPARLKTPALARATGRWIRQHSKEIDVVHVQQLHPQGAAAARAAKAAGLAVVTTIHAKTASRNRLRALADRRAEAALLRGSDALVFVSEHTRASFGSPAGTVIRNGIGREVLEASRGPRDEARRRVGAGDRFAFLFAGRQERGKGYPDLLEAAARLPQSPAWVLLARGQKLPSEVAPLRRRERLLGSAFVDLGTGARGSWGPFLAADAFVLPSRHEGLPMALLEAMAFGLSVVASPVGGVPEVIGGDEALLVPAGDVAALEAALRDLLRDPAEARVRGAAGRERVLREFTMDRCASRYRDLFESVL